MSGEAECCCCLRRLLTLIAMPYLYPMVLFACRISCMYNVLGVLGLTVCLLAGLYVSHSAQMWQVGVFVRSACSCC